MSTSKKTKTLKSLIMTNVITYLYFKMLQEIILKQHLGRLKYCFKGKNFLSDTKALYIYKFKKYILKYIFS